MYRRGMACSVFGICRFCTICRRKRSVSMTFCSLYRTRLWICLMCVLALFFLQIVEILKDRPSWFRDCQHLEVFTMLPAGNSGTIELVYMQIIGVVVKHSFLKAAPVLPKLDRVSLYEDITLPLPNLFLNWIMCLYTKQLLEKNSRIGVLMNRWEISCLRWFYQGRRRSFMRC